MKKTFKLILITVGTIALIYGLTYKTEMQSFAFACSLLILLMVGVRSFTETLKSPLTSSYFKQKPWERRGKIYELLGINFYRKLLVWIGWEKVSQKTKPVKKNTKTLIHLYHETKHDELGHLIILIIVIGFNIFVAFKFGVLNSLWLFVLKILTNLYPVLLQRYNRPRIERAINLSIHR